MALIDHKYKNFKSGELRLKLIKLTENAEILARIDDACIDAEVFILKKLFGEVEYLNFQNNLTTEFNSLLQNGYQVDNIYQPYDSDKVFYGINDMISFFAFYYYLKTLNNDKTTPEYQPSWPKYKMVDIYNNGVKRYYQAIDFIDYKKSLDSTLLEYIETEDLELINTFGI